MIAPVQHRRQPEHLNPNHPGVGLTVHYRDTGRCLPATLQAVGDRDNDIFALLQLDTGETLVAMIYNWFEGDMMPGHWHNAEHQMCPPSDAWPRRWEAE